LDARTGRGEWRRVRIDHAVRQVEPDLRLSHLRGHRRDVQQLQESKLRRLRRPVEPIEQVVPKEGEQIDQRNTGIGRVMVRPLRRVDRNAAN
jgi:hypothetical protein